MNKLIALVPISLVAILAGGSAQNKAPGSPEKTALEFVNSMLFDRDVEKAVAFFHKDAERKTDGKGSAIEMARKQIPRLPTGDQLTLREINFFRNADIPALTERYPSFRWSRVGERIDDGLGCLIVMRVRTPDGEEGTGLASYIFKKIDGQYRIVHQDDN